MDGIISIAAIVLVIIYVIIAVNVIWKRRTIRGTVGASIGFLLGGVAIVPYAEAVAGFVFWAAVVCFVLFLASLIF